MFYTVDNEIIKNDILNFLMFLNESWHILYTMLAYIIY